MSVYNINIPENLDVKTVKAVLKALGVTIEKPKEKRATKKENPYNPEFVAKIQEGRRQIKAGNTVKVSLDDIWK